MMGGLIGTENNSVAAAPVNVLKVKCTIFFVLVAVLAFRCSPPIKLLLIFLCYFGITNYCNYIQTGLQTCKHILEVMLITYTPACSALRPTQGGR